MVRLSGREAGPILRKVFRPAADSPWCVPRRLCLGDVTAHQGTTLDHALAVFFEAPDSFTGEDVAELHLHGAPGIVRGVMDAVQRLGARRALPGEFSYRAFLNAKISLMAAEAINVLVTAETESQATDLGRGLRGGLEDELRAMLGRILDLRARWEAQIDFPEDVSEGRPMAETGEVGEIVERLSDLLATSRSLRRLREGWRVALVGPVNSGKSSLFNALLHRERALVTPHPGTTRDVLEEAIQVAGYPLVLLDTAGLRPTPDPVETVGQAWGLQAARDADATLLVYDMARGWGEPEETVLRALQVPPLAVVGNKRDLADGVIARDHLRVSAVTGEGLGDLISLLGAWMEEEAPRGREILLSERQVEVTARALDGARRALEAWTEGRSEELALQGLVQAQRSLEELLTGKGDEDLYDLIFSRFCVGK